MSLIQAMGKVASGVVVRGKTLHLLAEKIPLWVVERMVLRTYKLYWRLGAGGKMEMVLPGWAGCSPAQPSVDEKN
jgi:hypothetical protein